MGSFKKCKKDDFNKCKSGLKKKKKKVKKKKHKGTPPPKKLSRRHKKYNDAVKMLAKKSGYTVLEITQMISTGIIKGLDATMSMDIPWDVYYSGTDDKLDQALRSPQEGGFAPLCLPCLSPILTGLGVLGASAGATAVASKASSVYSSSKSVNGKVSRKGDYMLSRKTNGKTSKEKYTIRQKNRVVTFKKGKGKKRTKKFKTVKKAMKYFDKLIETCDKKGFKKC